MLLLTLVLIALITILISTRLRVPVGVKPGHLGWMSDQWLAEYRASHAS